MSEFMREAFPIIFMYGCVLALGPFIAVAMWMAFDGDRLRETADETASQPAEAQVDLREHETASAQRTAEVTSAA